MVWEAVDDDIIQEGTSETERTKTYYFPVGEYAKWIKDLEKAGLKYVRHDRRSQKKKNQWVERWYCHCYGTYVSVAGKNTNKKPRLAQKESKKHGCKSYIQAILPKNSTTVIDFTTLLQAS